MNAKKSLAVAGLMAAGCLLSTLVTTRAQGGAKIAPFGGCGNLHAVEPVLIYDTSGSTLIGPTHLQLSLYTNGLATISERTPLGTPATGMVDSKIVSLTSLQSLWTSLMRAGAYGLCDDTSLVMDVPLATVTLFAAPDTDSESHTFSYYPVVGGPHGAVEAIVQAFIATEFPRL